MTSIEKILKRLEEHKENRFNSLYVRPEETELYFLILINKITLEEMGYTVENWENSFKEKMLIVSWK